jgi:maltose O-acetyltransferase
MRCRPPMNSDSQPHGAMARLGRSLVFDYRLAMRHTFVNRLAGSHWVPRAARAVLYRIGGLDVRTHQVAPGCLFTGRGVHIGTGTVVNWGSCFEGDRISIGKDCQIGMQTLFVTAHHPPDGSGRPTMEYQQLPIDVGDGCWLGARVVVLPGVNITDGVTVAAGAVVTEDLRVPGLYAGVPAVLRRPLAVP